MFSRPVSILRTVMAAAIRERQLLAVTYSGATEPQLFARVALYVSASNQLVLDGYEVKGDRRRWREIEIAEVRDVQQTMQTFDLDSDTPIGKTYPIGATVIVQASSQPS